MYSRDLVLPIFGCLCSVHVDFDSVEDGSKACKNCVINRSVSKQRMMNIMGLQGGHKKNRGVDFLLLCAFIAPLTSANCWYRARVLECAFWAPQHEGRAPSDGLAAAHTQPGWRHTPASRGKKLKTSEAESIHKWPFLQAAPNFMFSLRRVETPCPNCQCWHTRRGLPPAERLAEHLPCSQHLQTWSCRALKNPVWIIKPVGRQSPSRRTSQFVAASAGTSSCFLSENEF